MRTTANETEHDTILRIMRAIDRQQPITIAYTKADDTETVRTIETYAIEVSKAGDVLLKAMDRQSGEKRTFRLDRITAYQTHRGRYLLELPYGTAFIPSAFCSDCGGLYDADELTPSPAADPACADCHANWTGADDAAEWRAYQYS